MPPVSECRTSDVLALCAGMREARDYSAAPILADALQDAGCDDEALLLTLRANASRVLTEQAVALAYSDETAAAVAYLEGFAGATGYSYAKIVDGAREYVETGEAYTGGAGYNFNHPEYHAAWAAQGMFAHNSNIFGNDVEKLNEFFDAYARVTSEPVSPERRADVPFECPCG